jgi:hypothetical protein
MRPDLDELIDEALGAEERDLLRAIGEEPGFFSQAFGVFGGPGGWMNILLMVIQGLVFVAGVWAGWHFFQADEPLAALRWGLPSAVLLLMALMIKLALMPVMQANRIIREMKSLELQLARAGRD